MKGSKAKIERHYSVKEAAEVLGVHPCFLFRRIQTGELPAVKLSARRVVIPESALKAFIDARRTVKPDTLLSSDMVV